MRIRPDTRIARTAFASTLVALATISLGACGPDEGSSVSARSASQTTPLPRDAAVSPSSGINLPVASEAGAGTNADAMASDPAQSAQASLAADSQQVAPVMSYAPGDGALQQASNGNSSNP